MNQTVSLLARAVSNKARTLVGYEKLLARLPDEKLKTALTGIIENEQRHLEMLGSILTILADEKGESGDSSKPGTKKTSPKANTGYDLTLVQKILQSALKSTQGSQAGEGKAAADTVVPRYQWAMLSTAQSQSALGPKLVKGLVTALKEELSQDGDSPKAEDVPEVLEAEPADAPVLTGVEAGGEREAEDADSAQVSEAQPIPDSETAKPDEESGEGVENPTPKKFKPLVWKFF